MASVNPLREFLFALMADRVASRFVESRVFPNEKALKKYLRKHPKADKGLHWVEKEDHSKKEEEKKEKDKGGQGQGEGGAAKKAPKIKVTKVHVPKPTQPDRKPAGKGKPPKDPKTAARVGLPGKTVAPPPKELPRLTKGLTKDEKLIQDTMCQLFEKDPEKAAKAFTDKIAAKNNYTFEMDAAKGLLPGWSRPDLPDDPKNKVHPERADFRGRYNAVLHQAASAICKKAFMNRLDELAKLPEDDPKRRILVTSGGVAAGKGLALGGAPELSAGVGATWDAAGEQNCTENEWIMEECEKRGLKPSFLFVHADPIKTWQGVVNRAKGQGRMVDAQLFADSYATGAKNFKAFYDKYKDKANFTFGTLEKDDKGVPLMEDDLDAEGKQQKDEKGNVKRKPRPVKPMREFPDDALKYTTEQIYEAASKELDRAYDAKEISDHIYQGGTAGRRFFEEE